MNKLLLPVATIFIAGCLTPQLYTTNGQFGEKKSITKIINDSGLETNIGIKAVSLKTGKTLFELNSNSLFNPASNNKLYTAIAALSICLLYTSPSPRD